MEGLTPSKLEKWQIYKKGKAIALPFQHLKIVLLKTKNWGLSHLEGRFRNELGTIQPL